ncbi:MAG: hypothetical protein ACI88C_002234 [Acidimicrobiales bacterium]
MAAQEERFSYISFEQAPTAFTQIEALAGDIGQRLMAIQIRIEGIERLEFNHGLHATHSTEGTATSETGLPR